MMQMIVAMYKQGETALAKGGSIADFLGDPVIEKMGRARYVPENEFKAYKAEFDGAIKSAFMGSAVKA
jgi:V/A-type H+-transporting ATPase subunit A